MLVGFGRGLIFFVLLVLTSGCSQYRYAGTRQVQECSQRVGLVADSLIKYFPLRVRHFPSETSHALELCLSKEMDLKVQYNAKTHVERVMKRQRSILEYHAEELADTFENYPVLGVVYLALWPSFVLLDYLAGNKPYEQTAYESVAGTDSIKVSYRHEKKTIPAGGETLVAAGIDTAITNAHGTAFFYFQPEEFDTGMRVIHQETRDAYIIRRVKKERKVKADWLTEAKIISNIVGAVITIRKVKNIAAAGLGPQVMAAAIAIDVVTGVVVGWIIDLVGTKTEEYYQWIVVKV